MENLLNTPGIHSGRRIGNTTRQVNYAIQLLFEGKEIEVKDHYENGTQREANHNLFCRIIDRLVFEHGLGRDDFIIKKGEFNIMKLIKR